MQKGKKKKRKPSWLSFKIGKEDYAVSTLKVLEVIEKQQITPIPNSPEYIIGVIPFRGNVIPVVSMHKKFNLNFAKKITELVIIIFDTSLNNKKTLIAGAVDTVNEVIAIEETQIGELYKPAISYNTEFAQGIVNYQNKFITLLNIETIFSIEL